MFLTESIYAGIKKAWQFSSESIIFGLNLDTSTYRSREKPRPHAYRTLSFVYIIVDESPHMIPYTETS